MRFTFTTYEKNTGGRVDVCTRIEDFENNYLNFEDYFVIIEDNLPNKHPKTTIVSLEDWIDWRESMERSFAWKPEKTFPTAVDKLIKDIDELPQKGKEYFVEDDGFHPTMSMYASKEECEEASRKHWEEVQKYPRKSAMISQNAGEAHAQGWNSGYQLGYEAGTKEGFEEGIKHASEFVEVEVDGATHKLLLRATEVQKAFIDKVNKESAEKDFKMFDEDMTKRVGERLMDDEEESRILDEMLETKQGLQDAINPPHYKNFLDQYQWIETMCRIQRFRDNPEQFEAAIELQVRKYLDRCGRKDERLQELEKALWYMKFLVAYVKNGGVPIYIEDIEAILDDAGVSND
jgi:hypothetical protein